MGADGRQIELGKLSLIILKTATILSNDCAHAQCAYGVAGRACFYFSVTLPGDNDMVLLLLALLLTDFNMCLEMVSMARFIMSYGGKIPKITGTVDAFSLLTCPRGPLQSYNHFRGKGGN